LARTITIFFERTPTAVGGSREVHKIAMTPTDTAATAIEGLRTHPLRSSLTMLGIVIGIAAIIVVMSLGAGVRDLVLAQVQGLGSKTIVVLPGRHPRGPSDFAQVLSETLKEKDLAALEKKANVPTLSRVMPLVFGAATAEVSGQTYRPTIFGASELIPQLFDLVVERGNFFSAEDVRATSSVAIIGSKVREELFGSDDPIGRTLKIKGRSFRVIGLMPAKGQVSFFNFDEAVIVPYRTAQQYIFGIKYFHRFILEAAREQDIARTVADAILTLRESHRLESGTRDDFFIETQADLAARLGQITTILTLFLVAVAAISLVVGGIGIMNIMLVSVTDRTCEIGLRKAVGSTNKEIMGQFLVEATLLTLLGGIIGMLLGIVVAFLVSLAVRRFAGFSLEFTFPLSAAVVGFLVSTGIGLVFGLYPAFQAAKKSPIEALRYE